MIPPWVYLGLAALVLVAGVLLALFLLRHRRASATSSPAVEAWPEGPTPSSLPLRAAAPLAPAAAAPAYLETGKGAGQVPPPVPVAGAGAAKAVAVGGVTAAGREPEGGIDSPRAEPAVGQGGIEAQRSPRREPTPQVPRLPDEETRWLVDEFRRLGPLLPTKYAALGPLGVLWYHHDLYSGREQEVMNLRKEVESLCGTALHQKVQGLEQTLREKAESIRKLEGIVQDQARTISDFKNSTIAAEALVDERDRRIERLSLDRDQLHGELARDRQSIAELSAQLEERRVKIEAMEGESRDRERTRRLFTNDEITRREAQLAILLMST